jgi:hypothetical protein
MIYRWPPTGRRHAINRFSTAGKRAQILLYRDVAAKLMAEVTPGRETSLLILDLLIT